MQTRTPMAPGEFFDRLRRVRRGLSISSVFYVAGLSAMVATVLSAPLVITVVVALVVTGLCTAVAYRYGLRSEAVYRESLISDPRTSCASEGPTSSCGNESCRGAGGTCLDRFEQELGLRIMVREQTQLAAMVRGKVGLQVGVTAIWPLLTLLGLVLGRLSIPGSLLTLLLELSGLLGLLYVRWSVEQLASVPPDGGLWSNLG
ncbi:MAG: hypothetical protein ACP5O0_06355 [Acidimicrobiales bacterium]